jgi:hypothetical protein
LRPAPVHIFYYPQILNVNKYQKYHDKIAQVMTDTQLERPEKRPGLLSLDDWLKLEAEVEAKGGATRLAEGPAKKKSKMAANRIEATTIVTGRPSTNNGLNGNDLLSYAEPRSPIKVDLCGKNWVGLLTGRSTIFSPPPLISIPPINPPYTEYQQAHPRHPSPLYHESSPSLNLYTCLITLSERPSGSPPLGDPRTIFNRKKDAKQYAAKLAIEWLVANGYMPDDGNVSFPKVRPLQPQSASISASASANNNPANAASSSSTPASASASTPARPASSPTESFPQRVAMLCTSLAISPPTYKLVPHSEFPAMYSGYAVFENSPLVIGKVGEFHNVHGKRNAKEVCAEKVVGFLEGIVKARRGEAGREAAEIG